jgi:AcrR family transcriptional regulator
MAHREELLDAADRAVRRLGPEAAMSAIAGEAGITKPVLYRHFGDRDGLLRALAGRHLDRLRRRLRDALLTPTDVRGRLVLTTEAFLQVVTEDPSLYRFLTSGAGPDSPAALFTRGFTEELAQGLRIVPGFAPQDPRPALWAASLVGMVRAAGDAWLAAAAQLPPGEVAELLAELVDGGLTQRQCGPESYAEPRGPDLHPG